MKARALLFSPSVDGTVYAQVTQEPARPHFGLASVIACANAAALTALGLTSDTRSSRFSA
jgi:hypothetical protein